MATAGCASRLDRDALAAAVGYRRVVTSCLAAAKLSLQRVSIVIGALIGGRVLTRRPELLSDLADLVGVGTGLIAHRSSVAAHRSTGGVVRVTPAGRNGVAPHIRAARRSRGRYMTRRLTAIGADASAQRGSMRSSHPTSTEENPWH